MVNKSFGNCFVNQSTRISPIRRYDERLVEIRLVVHRTLEANSVRNASDNRQNQKYCRKRCCARLKKQLGYLELFAMKLKIIITLCCVFQTISSREISSVESLFSMNSFVQICIFIDMLRLNWWDFFLRKCDFSWISTVVVTYCWRWRCGRWFSTVSSFASEFSWVTLLWWKHNFIQMDSYCCSLPSLVRTLHLIDPFQSSMFKCSFDQ